MCIFKEPPPGMFIVPDKDDITQVSGCGRYTVYPKKYAHGFVVLCFVVVMQSFIMNSHEVFIHIHRGCFAGTGAIVRLPQCQWSKPDGYGKISQCITTTKHSKAKTVCIFLGIYCRYGGDFKSVISEYMLRIKFMSTCEIAFRWMPRNTFDNKSASSSGNGLVPSGKKPLPEPELMQICGAIWHH